jgi:hypothetical protein
MVVLNEASSKWAQRVVLLSLMLLFFTIPHTLEDFATGVPVEAGIPAPLLAFDLSIIFSLQLLGLFWLGQKQRRGLLIHVGIGLFWSIASGLAQLPDILNKTPYRYGAISIFYVGGMIAVGALLCLSSILSIIYSSKTT